MGHSQFTTLQTRARNSVQGGESEYANDSPQKTTFGDIRHSEASPSKKIFA